MKKLITIITIALISLVSGHFAPTHAQEYISEPSAQLSLSQLLHAKKVEIVAHQAKREAMIRVLTRYKSPLVDHVDSFLDATDRYDHEDYFLISIAGVESTFAKRMIHGTHNPYGYGKGRIVFDSWDHGVDVLGYKLRENYINKGAVTIDQIGPRYAGGSSTWAPKVKHFMSEFKREEESILQVNQYL